MSTGAELTTIQSKRLMGTADFKDRFLDYLQEGIRENMERVYRSDGVWDQELALAAGGTDRYTLSGALSDYSTDGIGHVLEHTDIKAGAYFFENTNAIVYQVGLVHALLPQGFETNPRTGLPNFTNESEIVGRRGAPDAVTDNGNGTITFVVDGITEALVSNAGRQVAVFKKQPGKNATAEAEIIETVTLAYIGNQNRATTVGKFGQDTVSILASDYECVLIGPRTSRNTDISALDGIAFVGTVGGVGAGGSPIAFDMSAQTPLIGSLANLSEITRIEAFNNRMKVEVKAGAGEVGIDQIRVVNPTGTTKYRVDEQGNVYIEGNLTVQGTTTQNNVVQVNSSETITDNLTAGDDQFTDTHLIKGDWRHTNNAAGANYFFVNGSTGLVGIGGTDDAVHNLTVTGSAAVTGDSDLFNLNVSNNVKSALVPDAANVYNLGSSALHWSSAFAQAASINTLDDLTGGSISLLTDIIPSVDDVRDVGSNANKLSAVYSHDLVLDAVAGRGVGSHVVPQLDSTYDLGTASRRWANIFVDNLNFAGDFLPQVDNTQDIGSLAFRWAEGWYGNALNVVTDSGASLPLVTDYGLLVYNDNVPNVASAIQYGTKSQSVVGALGTSQTTSIGLMAEATNNIIAGTLPTMVPVWASINAAGNGGTTTTASSVYGVSQVSVGHTVTNLSHIHAAAPTIVGGATNWRGVKVDGIVTGDVPGSVTTTYGIEIGNVNVAGATNYAIKTNTGAVEFGDVTRPSASNTVNLGETSKNWLNTYSQKWIGGSAPVAPDAMTYLSLIQGLSVGVNPTNVSDAFVDILVESSAGTANSNGLLSGMQVDVTNHRGNGTALATVEGLRMRIMNNHTAPNAECNVLRGMYVNPFNNAGHVNTSMYGVYIQMQTGSASLSTGASTGLFISQPSFLGAGVSGNSYAIHSAATSQAVRFDGWSHGQLKRTTAFLTADNWTNVTWSTRTHDNNQGGADLTRIDAGVGGEYLVAYTLPVGILGGSNNTVMGRITVNGVTQDEGQSKCGVHSAVGKNAISGTAIVTVAAGQPIRIQTVERDVSDLGPAVNSQLCGSTYNGAGDLNKGVGTFTVTLLRAT